jgi:hypothetical protein
MSERRELMTGPGPGIVANFIVESVDQGGRSVTIRVPRYCALLPDGSMYFDTEYSYVFNPMLEAASPNRNHGEVFFTPTKVVDLPAADLVRLTFQPDAPASCRDFIVGKQYGALFIVNYKVPDEPQN